MPMAASGDYFVPWDVVPVRLHTALFGSLPLPRASREWRNLARASGCSRMSSDIAPSYVRERRLALSLAPDAVPSANASLVIYVDYSKTMPEGVSVPMVLEIQGPSGASYKLRE